MKKILFCFFLIAISSCTENQSQFENQSYEVLSKLYDTLAVRMPIPPMPYSSKKISKTDSLKNIETIIKLTKLRDSIQQIVAINPFFSEARIENINLSKVNVDFKKLVIKLDSIKGELPLEIKRIKTKRKDSIIAFHDNLLDPMVSDYLKFDKLISFSRVVFNEECTKAVLVASSGTSRRAGFSGLYFLRKINEEWVIVDYLGISIS